MPIKSIEELGFGVYVFEVKVFPDERGFVCERFPSDHFREKTGIDFKFRQWNQVFTNKAGNLRGVHFQKKPYCQSKIVTCTRGMILDGALNLDPQHKDFGKFVCTVLSGDNFKAIYIPPYCGHLVYYIEPDSEIFYLMGDHKYEPDQESGIRWNDPDLEIRDVIKASVGPDPQPNERDASYPTLQEALELGSLDF